MPMFILVVVIHKHALSYKAIIGHPNFSNFGKFMLIFVTIAKFIKMAIFVIVFAH